MSKNILITGCSTGFGFDASKYLASKGHNVFATMRAVEDKNAEAAQALRDYATENDVSISVFEIDVTSDASVKSAVSQMPHIDVLINNAGLGYGGPIEAFSIEQFQAQMDVNVTGIMRMAKAVLPGMRKRRSGLLIQVSSIAGRFAGPGLGIYHCSKWAVEGLSESLRYELSPLGIDVVLVEPGPFATSFFGNVLPGLDEEIMADYGHVKEYSDGFGEAVMQIFEDPNTPSDPMIIVKIFEDLIDAPNGSRPLRTVAGLDFGAIAINDAVEPVRQSILESFEISGWDGPSAEKPHESVAT